MPKKKLEIPEPVLRAIRSDIQAYLRHGYDFEDFVERNTNGRKYGNDLKEIWKEEENGHLIR